MKRIFTDNPAWMSLVDRASLTDLEGRIPKLCKEDADDIREGMKTGTLLPALNDPEVRKKVLENLLLIDCPIPTLDMLFDDLKFLSPLSDIMKGLIDEPTKKPVEKPVKKEPVKKKSAKKKSVKEKSISQKFQEMFTDVNQREEEVLIQEQRYSLEAYPGNKSDRITLGIWQLWLFAARNLSDLISKCLKKEAKLSSLEPHQPDVAVWCDFATLAHRLGFESDRINFLKSQNPDREKARAAILNARSPSEFVYDESLFSHYQDEIVTMFASATESKTSYLPRMRTVDAGESRKRRSGRPFEDAYNDYRRSLFPPAFWSPIEADGKGVTALFIRIAICDAFFGKQYTKISNRSPLGPIVSVFRPLLSVTAGSSTRDVAGRTRQLNNQIDALRKDLDSIKNDKESISCKNIELQVRLDKCEGEKKASAENYERHIAAIRSQLTNLDSRMHDVTSSASSIENSKSQLQSRVRELEAQNKLQNEELEKAKGDVLLLQQSTGSLKNENEILQQELQGLHTANREVVQQRDYLEGKINDYQAAQAENSPTQA